MLFLDEGQVQNLLKNDSIVRNGFYSCLGLKLDDKTTSLIPEDEYINGICADFTLICNNEIRAIVECKAGNINVTDYVRGIGQLFQYEYFYENNINHRGFSFTKDANFKTVYFYPSSVLRLNSFNVGAFKYPETMIICELNEVNSAVRIIPKSDLKKLSEIYDKNIVSISQYYFRDTRIFEEYILLKYLALQRQLGAECCDRKKIEYEIREVGSINNNNWRNTFITLSSIGLINNRNLPTEAGYSLANKTYDKFAVEMYKSYLRPYFDEIMKVFNECDKMQISNASIADKIRNSFRGKEVMFLTESNNRYISSFLNIMRDDYGIISFSSRKDERLVNYDPRVLNDDGLAEKIRTFSIANQYIERYREFIKRKYSK